MQQERKYQHTAFVLDNCKQSKGREKIMMQKRLNIGRRLKANDRCNLCKIFI